MPLSEELQHMRIVELGKRATKRRQIRHLRKSKYNKRRKAKKKAVTKRQRRIDKIPMSEMLSSIGRRRARALAERLTPEERSAIAKRAATTRAIRRQFCEHLKPPKFRKGGKNAGRWACPSCHEPVPTPKQTMEEEIVT